MSTAEAAAAKPEKPVREKPIYRTMFDPHSRTKHPVEPGRVEPGHVMSILQYVKVDRRWKDLGRDALALTDVDSGLPFNRIGAELIVGMRSADQVIEVQQVSRTMLIKLLAAAGERPVTVHWTKQNGEKRTLRGLIYTTDEQSQGYLKALDLEKPISDRDRKVDCRTIEWAILDGVRYEVK